MPFLVQRSTHNSVRTARNTERSRKKSARASTRTTHRSSIAVSPASLSSTLADRLNMMSAGIALSQDLPSWLDVTLLIEEPPEAVTQSSELQLETAEECLPLLRGEHNLVEVSEYGVPRLDRRKHVKFLSHALGRLPSPFTGLDASRPWMFYWTSMALSLLGEDTSGLRKDLATTLRPIQNPSGGFGGGNGQMSHLATTYASVLSLATVGGEEAYELIDRKAMWKWLGRLKQPSGDFLVTEDGENDVRGALCAMVMLSLLNLPIELPPDSPARSSGCETFLTGLAEWISQCQSYEGGLGSIPDAEAHGAYTFCGLACLCILGDPQTMFSKYLDMPALISWLTRRQHAPEGGNAGRSNKLVDGCYSHWIGGCWSLVEAACRSDKSPPSLFNREALIRYILCCCQADRGGLRDKPSKPPDAYHTLYNLAGLSSAQNYYSYSPSAEEPKPLNAAFNWTASKEPPNGESIRSFSEGDRVPLMHPIYVIPWGAAEKMRAYFDERPLIWV